MRRLTKTQSQWLIDLANGKNPWDKIRGQSAHGGATCTVMSLIRRRLVEREDPSKLTEEGKLLAAQYANPLWSKWNEGVGSWLSA